MRAFSQNQQSGFVRANKPAKCTKRQRRSISKADNFAEAERIVISEITINSLSVSGAALARQLFLRTRSV